MALLYGKPVADQILAETKARIQTAGLVPGLAAILVGDNASSHLYVDLKEKAAGEIGMHFEKHLFAETASASEILAAIAGLNERNDIHGIIVQLPLPHGFVPDAIIAAIAPQKDADGFQEATVARFLAGDNAACPVFPRAMLALLRHGKGYYLGDTALALVNSDLLGRVLVEALLLEGLQAEYVLSSGQSDSIAEKVKKAHVILTACGIPGLITGDMITPDAIVIDGGISQQEGSVVGDADRASVETKARFLTPVPGGVGPVTVATLLARVTDAALRIKE